MSETTGFYEDPTIYDILHAPGTADEARAVAGLAGDALGRAGGLTFLEPACGTARHLRWLATRGHRGVGFDLSDAMIADAKRRAARAGLSRRLDLFVGDMTDFAASVERPIDAAFNLINTIRHLHTDRARLDHLACVERVLSPGGVYIVGVSTTLYGIEMPSEDVWVGARGPCRVTQVVNYLPADASDRRERVISHLHIHRPGGDEHRDSAYPLRSYSLDEWARLIGRSPLRIARVTDQDGADTDPPALGYALFVLSRR